jgi:hypothetical protein
MARKSKDTIYQEFLAELKAINPKIEEVLADERVSTKLKESVLARADYSQSMDDLKTSRAEMESFLAAEKQKIAGWQEWYTKSSTEYTTTVDKLKRYQEEFGDLDDAGQRREAAKHGLTPEEFEQKLGAELTKREAAYLKFADDLTDLKIEHRQKFGEKLDTGALYKIAGEKSLPLDVAYNVFIADKEAELRKKDFDEQLTKAKEEGAREALAKHNLPVLSNDSSVVHVLDVKDAPRSSNDRVSAAVAGFMSRNNR